MLPTERQLGAWPRTRTLHTVKKRQRILSLESIGLSMLQALDAARAELGGPSTPAMGTSPWVRTVKGDKQVHNLTWQGKGYACSLCFRRFHALPRAGQLCLGAPLDIRGILKSATILGHNMQLFLTAGARPDLCRMHSLRFLFCTEMQASFHPGR